MSTPLRVLIVEDSDDDVLLVVRALTRGGYDLSHERVETIADLSEALTTRAWDLIISDHRLPGITSFDVLRTVRHYQLDVPFIIVSGIIGEESAIEALKAGAHDYILKGNLTRLIPAVQRELRDSADRAARRQAQEALHQSENRFRVLIENVSDLITVLSADHRIVYQSPASEAILGYLPDEMIGTDLFDIVDAEDRAILDNHIQIARANPKATRRGEIHVQHRDGSRHVLEIIVKSVLDDPTIAGIVVSGRDITEREELEAQLRQSQKMEAFGQFAGGIAHDFSNLLTVIIGFGELLHTKLPADSPYREAVQQIRQAGESAASLTRQLLAFSRRQIIAPKELDLNEVVEHFGKMLRRVIGEDVNLVLTLAPRLGIVKADPGQIEQILMNLGTNGRDAMPRGGDLSIVTANVVLDQAYVQTHPAAKPGPYVRLSVTDTGTGMDPTTRARIFEPFFTTKEEGRGTGLGLPAVYGIVSQSGGSIDVSSQLGHGTTVTVYFPRVVTPLSPVDSHYPSIEVPGGTETILVVEDDQRLRKLVRIVLEGSGYTVLEADGAEQAFSIAAAPEQPIDLLLTDVVLPDVGGRQVAERLLAMRPGLIVLFMSGYTDDIVLRQGVQEAAINFLPKPLTPSSLVKKVREVLDTAKR
jgi:two-component system cell cycle sensor histidine kinase/response regulator CckA